MLAMKIIKAAQTEWAVPLIFTPKKDGSLQFCIDYRKLNGVTVQLSLYSMHVRVYRRHGRCKDILNN